MTASPDDCFHLNVEIVREIHSEVISRFGGADGVRDVALLESAVAAPQASFGGKSPYADLEEVAAAYLFYLCRNHPFLDGNKRVALGACLVFLRLNGSSLSLMGRDGKLSPWMSQPAYWIATRPPHACGTFCLPDGPRSSRSS